MVKVDENKIYKFSEIIIMLENKELPENSRIFNSSDFSFTVKRTRPDTYGLNGSNKLNENGVTILACIFASVIKMSWNIEWAEEDKFWLKAPGDFEEGLYLNRCDFRDQYSLNGSFQTGEYQTEFTQREIDDMPFDVNFFEQIKIEEENEK